MTRSDIAPEDALRADLYDFLAAWLSAPPPESLMERTAKLKGDASPLGRALAALARLSDAIDPHAARAEYETLFIGLGQGELMPYASFYLTGFINDKPLARLRTDMMRLGLARGEATRDPEDHVASLMEIMAALIRGRHTAPAPIRLQREIFETHVAPWAGRFFADLEASKTSVLYAPVGTLGRVFLEIETEAFRLAGEDA